MHVAAQTAHVDVDEAAWLALPGRSDRTSGWALRERLTGVLARQAGQAADCGRIGPLPRGAADVVVHRAALAPPGFDARFSALARRYVYRVADAASGPAGRDPLRRGAVLWADGELDVAAMAAAAWLCPRLTLPGNPSMTPKSWRRIWVAPLPACPSSRPWMP